MTMPPIHMSPQEWDQVASILQQYLPSREVFAFGSRATGKRLKKYSDLDLAIPEPSISAQHGDLVDAFDESLLPFKVDIVDLATVNPTFRARIEPDFVSLAAFIPARIGIATTSR